MEYEVVIGLEAHVQLSTASKIFCGCSTRFGATPNSQTCPVCLGLPGVLPVFNEEVFNSAIKTALAFNCAISQIMKFDRKNYYYPDLPKNFQISQYDMPLCANGRLEIETEKGLKTIGITRIHLEEDAGKLIHEAHSNTSLVDFNRSGIPLMEIVSKPDISSPEEAYQYLTNLKAVLQYLGVSDCNMEAGSLRCDANISVKPKGAKTLGTKVEIKNMNTFKGVKAALAYEAERQIALLEEGERIVQETRLWNADKAVTISMRSKEEAHDYRYFPEPDLVPFEIEKDRIERIRSTLPELPKERRERFQKEYKLSLYDASVLVADKETADYFEECVKILDSPKTIVNWVTQDIAYEVGASNLSIKVIKLKLPSYNLTKLIQMVESGQLSGKMGKDVLELMIKTGEDAETIVKEKGLVQLSSEGEIRDVVRSVLAENKKSVDDYKNGKDKVITYLIGQAMRKTGGRANPQVLNKILEEELKKEAA